jgi:NAD(P)-dependent dehydrogenase (short-subunit alcohol dehydrogenase family)
MERESPSSSFAQILWLLDVHQDFPTHAYDVSKAAVHSLTKKLAADLAQRTEGRPVTVNAIAPGYVPSKMTEGLAAWGVDADKAAKSIPLGRMGGAEDMAGAALFLASPAGAWVTGAVLPVDGGSLTAPLSMLDGGE